MKNPWLRKSEDRGCYHVCIICDPHRFEFYLDGELQEIRCFPKELNDEEIKDLCHTYFVGA